MFFFPEQTGPIGKKRPLSETKRKPKTYEYVDIHALYAGLKDVVAMCTGRVRIATHMNHEISMLVALIGLTGTDFTRKLPQMTGKSVYSWLPDLWPTLALAFDPATMTLREQYARDLVALLYRAKFSRHARSPGLEAVLSELRCSAMAPTIKGSLPSLERVVCTIRNVNWVLAYWTCQPAPDPLQPIYGFRVTSNGCTGYDDQP